MRWMAAILTVMMLVLGVGLAMAQTPPSAAVPELVPPLDPSPPADTGKPRFYAPPSASPAQNCAAAFDCRVRAIGAIQHDGAVELNATVLKW